MKRDTLVAMLLDQMRTRALKFRRTESPSLPANRVPVPSDSEDEVLLQSPGHDGVFQAEVQSSTEDDKEEKSNSSNDEHRDVGTEENRNATDEESVEELSDEVVYECGQKVMLHGLERCVAYNNAIVEIVQKRLDGSYICEGSDGKLLGC